MGYSILRKKKTPPVNMMPDGWQFYQRPTNLEPPGTIFRIDHEGRRIIVTRLKPKVDRGSEPGSKSIESIETKMGVLARLLGLKPLSANVGGGKARIIEYEIMEPVRESTTDENIDKVLKPYLPKMERRRRNRYYLIRDSRSATDIRYLLSSKQLAEIGGEAALNIAIAAGVNLSFKSEKVYDLYRGFPERLSVMFLAEEIGPVGQGLAAGEIKLGRIPVKGVLDWMEPDTD